VPDNAYEPLAPGETYKPVVPAKVVMPESTTRSVGWGVVLCVIFTVASAYSGPKVGQVMEAAISISILAIGLARVHRRQSTILENVIVTGVGGVSGSVVAGAIFTLPALYALSLSPNPLQTTFICLAGGCPGVLFLIPLLGRCAGPACGQKLRAVLADVVPASGLDAGERLGRSRRRPQDLDRHDPLRAPQPHVLAQR